MELKIEKLKAGDMICPSAFGLILPLGLASALVLVVELLGILVFFLGLLKRPESVIESFVEGNPLLYTILGGYVLFGGLQVLVRVMLAKTRIVVGVDTIQRKGVFSTHEISTSLVEQITKYQRFFQTDLHLLIPRLVACAQPVVHFRATCKEDHARCGENGGQFGGPAYFTGSNHRIGCSCRKSPLRRATGIPGAVCRCCGPTR